MQGKTVVITGASSGIGLATAQALARQGAHVVMVNRHPERSAQARAHIRSQSPEARVDEVLADLLLQSEVRRAAEELLGRFPRIDVLLHNAGQIFTERQLTAEGVERTFALNHLAPFLLTALLRGRLEASAPSRIVLVSSWGHKLALGAPEEAAKAEPWRGQFPVYGRSKLANLWFTREAARRFDPSQVTVNALHPGIVATNFGSHGEWWLGLGMSLGRAVLLSPEQGARTGVYLASSDAVHGVSGRYFARCKPQTPSARARSAAEAEACWALSERLCGLSWPAPREGTAQAPQG